MRNNYINILESRVEIPIIQRDYAQGRTDNKTNKIRKDFLDAIFEFILLKRNNPEAELDLDFIYGINKESSTFVPIDGQQRLTTLWLLYWFVAAKEKVISGEKQFLKNFIYETRHSTTQFCKSLIAFAPDFSNDFIGGEIKNQSWYFETWNYDPCIQAMLVVLNDIEKRYADHSLTNLWDLIGNTACPFYFYKLDMDKVGLTDDLYIKMNSRGKPLTEFEYFKAVFTDLLTDSKQREKFETSIDGVWIDTVWQIVFEEHDEDEDIASAVDQAFLNLFNFISSVISFKQDIRNSDGEYYEDTEATPELLKRIYGDSSNQKYLFDTLDSICVNRQNNQDFWNSAFYYAKNEFKPIKIRLYFQHGETNLLNRCLFYFDEYRGLTFPERILLLACFAHFRKDDSDFEQHIRAIRNLVVNSEFELRETSLGKSYDEAEQYILSGDPNVFNSFKTDQIEEEKQKHKHLSSSGQATSVLRQLEDSDIFRGSITLIPLDDKFETRATLFLELFDEDEMISDFEEKCNLLLCFGDYSQADGDLTNLSANSKVGFRKLFTTPGYNKSQLYSNTQHVVNACLDFFTENSTISASQKIERTLKDFDSSPKDWKYYFLKYPSFREHSQYGYYLFSEEYPMWKMGKKRFNGYHWNPFLHEVYLMDQSEKLSLGKYGTYDKLVVTKGRTKVHISGISEEAGFYFENGNPTVNENPVLKCLVENGWIDEDYKLLIDQNADGCDLEDRIEKLELVIKKITG